MNLKVIETAASADDRHFFRDVVKRLAKVFPTPLEQADAEVLGHALTLYTIQFRDGFILNGSDSTSLIGRSDAAIILAALCDVFNQSWEWWRTQISPVQMPQFEFDERLERILGRMIRHRSIRCISK